MQRRAGANRGRQGVGQARGLLVPGLCLRCDAYAPPQLAYGATFNPTIAVVLEQRSARVRLLPGSKMATTAVLPNDLYRALIYWPWI